MTKRQPIRDVPKGPSDRRIFDAAVKQRLELLLAELNDPIEPLNPATATAATCAAKINEILALLQG